MRQEKRDAMTTDTGTEAMRIVAKFHEQNALNRTCETLGLLRKQVLFGHQVSAGERTLKHPEAEAMRNAYMDASLQVAIDHTLRLYDMATNDFTTLLKANRDNADIMALVYKCLK